MEAALYYVRVRVRLLPRRAAAVARAGDVTKPLHPTLYHTPKHDDSGVLVMVSGRVVGVGPQVVDVDVGLLPADEDLELLGREHDEPLLVDQVKQPTPERRTLLPDLDVQPVVSNVIDVSAARGVEKANGSAVRRARKRAGVSMHEDRRCARHPRMQW